MSEQIEENFETLKKLFVSMSQAIIELEQKKVNLTKSNTTLNNANDMLQKYVNRLLQLNDKQRTMLSTLNESLDRNSLLQTEFDDLKKKYLELKNFINIEYPNIQEPCEVLDKHLQDTLENNNSLLQKRIDDLEKQLLNQTLSKKNSNFYDHDHDNEISKLQFKNNTLLIENKLLKEQLTNSRNMYSKIVSEIRLNNLKNTNGGSLQGETDKCISPMIIDVLDQNELQSIQVNVIDSDIES